MPARHDQRRQPPQAKYGLPGVSYPTPNIADFLITEDLPIRNYQSVAYGTAHPKDTSARLVWQGEVKGDDGTKAVRRIYAKSRAGQDAYNGHITYSGESKDHPIFTRTYLELRATYAPLTMGTALGSLIGLTLTAGGSGYAPVAGGTVESVGNGQVPLVFTGGTGSGAAGIAEVSQGVIVAVLLTACGSYTAVPTVTAASGTGASITAQLQPTTSLLVQQSQPEAAEAPLDSLFVRVTRVWETLPGPILITYDRDDETLAQVVISKQRIVKPAAGVIAALNVPGTEVKYYPENDAVGTEVTMTVVFAGNALDRTETQIAPYNFPAVIIDNVNESLVARDGTGFLSIHFNKYAARTRLTPHTIAISYAAPADLSLPAYVDLKTNDLFFDGAFIKVSQQNVLNDEFELIFDTGSTNPIWPPIVEDVTFLASEPTASVYVGTWIGTLKIISAIKKPWKFNLWRMEIVSVKML